MKILLADDSMTAQRMGAKILSEAGHEVLVVSNGAAAARKVLEFCPDAVVLDVYMPGYSGLELCERIKKTRETSHIPVLLTVGKLEPFRPEEGKRVHADGVVIKPFEASELLRCIGSITGEVLRDPRNSKRAEKSVAPVLETADPPVPHVAIGLGSPAPAPENLAYSEESSASQVPGPAEPSIAQGISEERVALFEDGISISDGNPVLETPAAVPLPPPLSPAVFVVEPIEINAADQESLEASAATLETAPALASEPPPQISQESFTNTLQAAAAEPQDESSADNPSGRASVADVANHEAPREVAVAATASIEPAVVVVDPPPANAAAPEPCGIAVVPSELACSAAGEVPVFPIEEIQVPEPPVAETKTEPSEFASLAVVCAPFAEEGPSCQPTPAPQMWDTQAEPPQPEPNAAPADESCQFTADPLQPAAADFVVDEAPVTSVEQVELPMPPESGEDFPEPAEGDVAPERSAELAVVAAIVGLVPTAISAETSFVSLGVPSPTEPAHDEEGAPHLPGFGRCGLAAGSNSPAPTQISAVDFLGTPTWAALAEELIAQNPKLPEDPSADLAMAAQLPPPPEADNIPAPEPASAASLPVLDEERVAAIVDAVLERLKPQLVAEIVRELCSKA